MDCQDTQEYNLCIKKGDDTELKFRYLTDNVPVDLTGAVIMFECTISTLTRAATVPTPITGEFIVTFIPSDTTSLIERRVRYEVVLYPTGLSGKKSTLFGGSMGLIEEEVQ